MTGSVRCTICFILTLLWTGCVSTQSTLDFNALSNYNQNAANQIIFLDFKIDGKAGQEKVKLINSVSGSGKMKNIFAPVHSPYQIRIAPHYAADHLETELAFEHPLSRMVEVSSESGILQKQSLSPKSGVVSVRIQDDKYLEQIEIYSITPEKGRVKIYTLNLKR